MIGIDRHAGLALIFRVAVYPSMIGNWIPARQASQYRAAGGVKRFSRDAARSLNVRFVPKADILRCSEERRYSITSSAVASSTGGKIRP